jgi:hypothetical protein
MQTPPPTYAADIKPLFRERDRRAMTFLFDLWDYEAVKENAEAILGATEGGDMPCDGAWPVERPLCCGGGSSKAVSRRSGRTSVPRRLAAPGDPADRPGTAAAPAPTPRP